MKFSILFAMLFCHIVDDYYLQGKLAQLKQKEWWEENFPDEKYKGDYLIALAEHAFSWAFVMQLPLGIYLFINNQLDIYSVQFCSLLIANWLIHAVIDHCKANLKIINLIQDQELHILQVIVTWLLFM